ncbi:TniQ family protein [Rhizobium phaseoli]|uniref:TniQ family protein n=1 Tax=Rhizobium phaseoli TaxID=396 RepID=UPI0007EB8E58|nr:TniQ family protein [Rhizobium phaseoli]ANL33891.1 TniQ family protein [Rhizobium phaseoli]ANL97616.1 TniQ family protein [Rhizobium phaseoli]
MYRVPLLDDESLTSFCSRFAAANVQSAPDFCLDMGFKFADVIKGHDVALNKLSAISGIPIERISRAAIRKSNKSWIVGTETILEKFFVRTGLRMCPVCFAEDERSTERMPGTRRYMRNTWHLQFVRTCHHHNCALNDFGRSPLHATRMHDLIENLAVADIDPGFGAVRPRNMTNFERFAIDRLEGIRRHGELLNGMSLERGGYLCQVLGTALLFGNEADQGSLNDERLWRAGAEGYDYLVRGKAGLRDALDVFHARINVVKADFGGGKIYGRFYKVLWDHDVPDWNEVKRVIHDYAFEALPLSKSADVFGTSSVERYLTEGELRRTFGIRPSHLRKFAVALGLIEPSLLKSGAMPVQAALKAHEFIRDSVLPSDAASLVGLSYPVFAKLKIAGVFTPSLEANREVSLGERYSRIRLQAVVDSIRPEKAMMATGNLLGLNAAAKACGFKAHKIVRLLQSKTLKNVGWDSKKTGFDAVLVDPEEIQSQYRAPANAGLSLAECEDRLRMGREALIDLCEAGYISSYIGKNKQNQTTQYLAAMDVDAFEKRYITLRGAIRRHRVSLKRVRYALDRSHVKIAIPAANRYTDFYLCTDVSNALAALAAIVIPTERDGASGSNAWYK